MNKIGIKVGDKVGVSGGKGLGFGVVRLMDFKGVTVDWYDGDTTIEQENHLVKVSSKKISMLEILGTFKNTYNLGMSWWQEWKAKNKQYDYHSTGSGLILVYEKGNKHILTFYPRLGKVFTDMSSDSMWY